MASFTVLEEDQLMLVTNEGQIIRIRVHGGEGDSIRVAGRKTQGVRLVDVSGGKDEKVVSAGLIRDADDEDDNGDDETAEGGAGAAAEASAEEMPIGEASASDPGSAAGDDEASD